LSAAVVERTFSHQPVLLQEAVEGLAVNGDGWYVDGTYGRGGHSAEILARLSEHGRLLALDKDPEAVEDGRRRFAKDARFTIKHCDFVTLKACIQPWLGAGRIAGLLLDLGVSSPQLESAQRGFSFAADGPLDMRMNSAAGQTAADWLAAATSAEIASVLREFGEVPRARQIAAAIVAARAQAPLTTTRELAAIAAAHADRRRHLNPATRVFQAVRIHINRELEALASCLEQSLELLATGGRLCVISFHSLEDRIVKRFMAREARGDPRYAGLPDIPGFALPRLKLIGGLVRPDDAQIERNPRARSARLRIAERLAVGSA
jgi:16S rRNA (cytosine1402-N4)-methyltransferase